MSGHSSSTLEHMRRLIAVDAALASRVGLHIGELSLSEGVSDKAIRRDLVLLRELVGEIRCDREPADNTPGHTYRHRYASRKMRLFSASGAKSV